MSYPVHVQVRGNPLQRCSWCILQPQLFRQLNFCDRIHVFVAEMVQRLVRRTRFLRGKRCNFEYYREVYSCFRCTLFLAILEMMIRVSCDKKQLWLRWSIIDLEGRVFANGPGDRGSISGRVISKTLKMVLDISLLNTQHKVRIKGKGSNPGKRVAPSPTSRCCSYWKVSLQVTLD